MTRKHTLDEVLTSLRKKNDCRVYPEESLVKVLNDKAKQRKNDLGNKSWGKIDYLCHYQEYTLLRVKEF